MIRRIALGCAYLFPWVGMSLAFAYIAANIFTAVQTGNREGLGWPIPGRYFLAFFILLMLDNVFLLIHAITDLFRNPAIPEGQKPLWAVILLIAPIALPVYGFIYIRRAEAPPPASSHLP